MNTRQEIIEFIDSNAVSGALLVTGKWGCGKTYLIGTIADEINAGDSFILITVSLFGVESIDALSHSIKEKVFFSQIMSRNATNIQRKAIAIKEKFIHFSAIFKEYSNIAKGINTALSINLYDFIKIEKELPCFQNNKVKNKKLVLVFDDLERSRIDLVNLLGAINHYTEDCGIKTIIIADEEKIAPEKYSEFKEKLISRTVKVVTPFESIIDSMISNYEETQAGYYNFLKRNASTIKQVFIESKSENLRSLKSILVDFERVFSAWNNTEVSKENLPYVFYIFAAMTFGAKNGSYKEGEYGYLFVDTDIKKTFANWQGAHLLISLRNWVVDGIWSEHDFQDELREKYKADTMSDDQKFLAYPFWDLEQEYITNGLPIAVKRAIEGTLSRNELSSLLQKIFALKKHNIPIPCEIDYTSIYSGFQKRKTKIFSGEVFEPKFRGLVEQLQIEDSAAPILNEIKSVDKQLIILENRRIFIDFLNKNANISRYSLKDLPIGSFDDEMLAEFMSRYFTAENYWKREMAYALLNLDFTNNCYINTEDINISINNLSALAKHIEQYIEHLPISIYTVIYNLFVCNINNLVASLKEKII